MRGNKNDNKYFFWDFAAKKYDFFRNLEKQSDIKVANDIVSNIEAGNKVLELACGTGRLSNLILERTPVDINYFATDFSQKMIEVCRNKNIPANFQIADANNLQYENKYFDYVIIGNALHIMPYPEKALEEIYRVLSDDGLLFAPQFLMPNTLREKFILDIIRLLGYKTFNDFELDSYLLLLENNGFKITKKEIYTCFRNMLYVSCCKQKPKKLVNNKQ